MGCREKIPCCGGGQEGKNGVAMGQPQQDGEQPAAPGQLPGVMGGCC